MPNKNSRVFNYQLYEKNSQASKRWDVRNYFLHSKLKFDLNLKIGKSISDASLHHVYKNNPSLPCKFLINKFYIITIFIFFF